MYKNFIFSGIGHAYGDHDATNEILEKAVNDGRLEGFDEERIKENEHYRNFLKKHPGITAFDYFAGVVMGFYNRKHVAPFLSTRKKILDSDTSVDLAVRAIDMALDNAGIHPENIGAWFISSGTPPLQAPGIASVIKGYFTTWDNLTLTSTLTSACVGFNINLQRAMEFIKCNPDVHHVVIAHAEVLSGLLTETTSFIPHATFGDGAAAVVLSLVKGNKKEGVISIVNNEDLSMLGNLGADKKGNLYMNPGNVKNTAVFDIVTSSKETLKKAGWKIEDIDLFIPHQTGNAIVYGSATELNIPADKIYIDVQKTKGNISGASVPAALSELKQSSKLKPGMKIHTATAGLGGEFGAFTYIVPENSKLKIPKVHPFHGQTVLVTGTTGGLGYEVAKNLAGKGAELILHYNSNDKKAGELAKELDQMDAKYRFIKSDFSNPEEVETLINRVKQKYDHLDYLVHTAAITGSLNRASDVTDAEVRKVAQVNQLAPVMITKALIEKVKKAVLYTGSVAEDAQFSGSSSYVASKQGLHGFAASFAGEAHSMDIRSIYYMIGVMDGGMAGLLTKEQIKKVMMSIGQKKLYSPEITAEKVVNSLIRPKIMNTYDETEGILLVRRDGYKRQGMGNT